MPRHIKRLWKKSKPLCYIQLVVHNSINIYVYKRKRVYSMFKVNNVDTYSQNKSRTLTKLSMHLLCQYVQMGLEIQNCDASSCRWLGAFHKMEHGSNETGAIKGQNYSEELQPYLVLTTSANYPKLRPPSFGLFVYFVLYLEFN